MTRSDPSPPSPDLKPSRGSSRPMTGPVRMMLPAACALLLVSVAVRAAHSLSNYNSLNFVSGAWVALARDLSEGIFYRPLAGEDGFGGTRFFPLQFICHAVLIRFGIEPFVAGYVLCIAWTLAP